LIPLHLGVCVLCFPMCCFLELCCVFCFWFFVCCCVILFVCVFWYYIFAYIVYSIKISKVNVLSVIFVLFAMLWILNIVSMNALKMFLCSKTFLGLWVNEMLCLRIFEEICMYDDLNFLNWILEWKVFYVLMYRNYWNTCRPCIILD